MDPKEIAKWASRFNKRGVKAAVEASEPAPPPAPRAQPAAPWALPQHHDAPVPFAAAPAGAAWGASRVETDVIVRPGPSNYANLLSQVPDLAPDMVGGADAMHDTMSPASAQALREAMSGTSASTVRDASGRVMGSVPSAGGPLISQDGIRAFPQPVGHMEIVPLAKIVGSSQAASAPTAPATPEPGKE